MLIETNSTANRLTIYLIGKIHWNDRLGLSRLMQVLRDSCAPEMAIDDREADEIDEGALLGLLSTAKRMAASEGKFFLRVTA